jgi:solute carrier family 25 (mitochondrial carnitine/acylcarnitine transporter), member 20/29
LYRGLASPLLTSSLLKSKAFTVYELSKASMFQPVQDAYSLKACLASGIVAGACVSLLSTPIDLIKVQMQLPENGNLYRNSVDCIKKLAVNGGLNGMYQGLFAQLLRESAGFGTYFFTYEFLCRSFSPTGKKQDVNRWTQFVCGGLSGVCLWSVIYPLDLVKTRIQKQANLTNAQKPFRGWLDCVRKSFRRHGIVGFYSGIEASLLRAFPVHSMIFLVYECCLRAL